MIKSSECPKAEEVAAQGAKIDLILKHIEEIKTELKLNTEARIYTEGLRAGQKEGIAKWVSCSVAAVNVIARVVSAGIMLGVLIAAGNTVGAVDFVIKFFGK